MATNVFINEFHYDNVGTDVGEALEIIAPVATSMTGWKLVLYNGGTTAAQAAAAVVYGTYDLAASSVMVKDLGNGFKSLVINFPTDGLQNGSPDGFAIINAANQVVQFLSYEGVMTGAPGTPAGGVTSIDVIRQEGTATPVGTSLQLTGSGSTYEDFTWAASQTSTFGNANTGQTLAGVAPPSPGTLSIADASTAEGNSGTHDIVFTVTRADGSAGAVSATWTATLPGGAGGADASDFGSGTAFTGTVAFAAGATSAEVRLAVQGDTTFEPDETFTVTLSAPTGGVTLTRATATGTITNDDAAPPAPPANVFINEIHYDNVGTDTGEAIEIAGTAGVNLSGYTLVFYNGSNTPAAAPVYDTLALSGVIDDEGNGYGALNFPRLGIQNGVADGVALIAPDGTVIQLLSYEGTFTAAAGTPAAGVTSTDIGVSEEPAVAVGLSLQLKGSGSSAADFTWTAASTSSFGSVNAGQTFLSATGTGHLRIDDARVAEGDTGTTNLVFVVHRAGGQATAATVAYQVVLDGTATLDDLAPGAPLSGTVSFAVGEFSKQIIVPIRTDTVGEGNETLSVTLGATTGNVVIDDGRAIGTIVNDDPIALSIGAIQGAGHISAYVGQTVITNGVVTAVDTNGFYLQSAVGDGNAATSDGIFVFTNTAPTVAVGDEARVTGSVAEYAGDAAGLTLTEINSTAVTTASSGNPLPAAILIGVGGLLPPTQVLDDDHLTVFDPTHDGLDFWESLEGMRVTLDTPQAVSNTTSFGETDVVVSRGVGATGINDRGGITISPNADGTVDYNPEKIQIDDDSGIFAGFTPNYTIGDQLTSVTGIVNYAFDAYEVLVTSAVSVTRDITLTQEVTSLKGNSNYLSIASYNLENLDTSDHKFDVLASNIVYNLRAPDIVAVQEVQDTDGAGNGPDLSGTVTAQGLIDAIYAQSGLRYAYIEIAPTTANTSGGEPGGNIRNGYLYNLDRVSYVDGSAALIQGSAYDGSRKPLVAQFQFAGQTVTTIDVHFTSRGGSEPLLGADQPAAAAGDAARTAQGAGVKSYVAGLLAADPSLNIAVLGDWNGFYFEDAQTQLTDPAKGGVFTNLNTLLPSQERYSYLFEGNAQQIDNVLVTGGLLPNAQYDSVHLNSQFGGNRPTDHDPQVALLMLGSAPLALTMLNGIVDENQPSGTNVAWLFAFDTPNDTLRYSLLDDAGGRFVVDPGTGMVTATRPLDYEAQASYQVVARATDSGGLFTDERFTVLVNDLVEGPAAQASLVDEVGANASWFAAGIGNDGDGSAMNLAYSLSDGVKLWDGGWQPELQTDVII